MIGILFYLEDIDNRFNPEMIDQWIFDAKMLGVTDVFMIDKTKYGMGQYYQNGDSEINLFRYTSFQTMKADYPNNTFVFLENEESFFNHGYISTNLTGYQHSDEAIYVFGPDTGVEDILSFASFDNAKYVCIESVQNIYSHAAMIITLYHRLNQ